MSTKLSESDLVGLRAYYADPEKYADIHALLDHITALEEELKSAQNELSKAARLINCAGPLDHRVQMMKLDYSEQITKLEEELKAAQERSSMLQQTLETRAERELEMIGIVERESVNDFRAQLVAAVRVQDSGDWTSQEVENFIKTFGSET